MKELQSKYYYEEQATISAVNIEKTGPWSSDWTDPKVIKFFFKHLKIKDKYILQKIKSHKGHKQNIALKI